jgi:hypothetical protein
LTDQLPEGSILYCTVTRQTLISDVPQGTPETKKSREHVCRRSYYMSFHNARAGVESVHWPRVASRFFLGFILFAYSSVSLPQVSPNSFASDFVDFDPELDSAPQTCCWPGACVEGMSYQECILSQLTIVNQVLNASDPSDPPGSDIFADEGSCGTVNSAYELTNPDALSGTILFLADHCVTAIEPSNLQTGVLFPAWVVAICSGWTYESCGGAADRTDTLAFWTVSEQTPDGDHHIYAQVPENGDLIVVTLDHSTLAIPLARTAYRPSAETLQDCALSPFLSPAPEDGAQ